MKGMQFTWNRQNNMCSFGKFLVGNPTRRPTPVAAGFRVSRHSSSQVTSTMGIPFSEGAFFSNLNSVYSVIA